MILKAIDLNENAACLWQYLEGPLVTDQDTLKVIGPTWCLWIGRVIFFIKDWWSKGEETRKVNALVLETLKGMCLQMQKPDSHWHFTFPQWNTGTVGGGEDGKGWWGKKIISYDMLAQKILQASRFPYQNAIKQEAQNVKDTFDQMDVTQAVAGLTREKVIIHVTQPHLFTTSDYLDQLTAYLKVQQIEPRHISVNGPTITHFELTLLAKSLKEEEDFLKG